RQFSVLFQSFVQYPLTLRDNIALSDYAEARNDGKILQALEQSGISEELGAKLDKGLDSYMTRQFDDEGIELSKGQWQKIALARAYFKGAPIVIFDEPSAALDAEAEDRIFRNFEKISGDKTGIMISHRISATRMSNKIIVLADGKVAESGTHQELAGSGGLYAKLYNLQKEKYVGKEAE
ncbi:MAG: ABC transporter ATP-binding protein/permease, partial [Lachnospiraceae bacterium]|nr:ABC transporter ATP-binding protein/permease [Lachnospiraceae bacterium]